MHYTNKLVGVSRGCDLDSGAIASSNLSPCTIASPTHQANANVFSRMNAHTPLPKLEAPPCAPHHILPPARACSWPLRDIATPNIVWFVAYTRGVDGGTYIAQ